MILSSIFSKPAPRKTEPQPDVCFQAADGAWPLRIVRHAQARQMKLQLVARDKVVRLTLPLRAPVRPALAWAETKRGWVEAQLARRRQEAPVMPGMAVPYRGREVRLDWSPAYARTPALVGDTIRIGGPSDGVKARLLRWLRKEALTLLEAETKALAVQAGRIVTRVGVGDPSSRWGSCSSAGAIRYSWRLILMPDSVRQMIVAHEVAHLVHMNHSPAFHALAASLAGADPVAANRWLKVHSARIHGFGGES